MAFARGAYPSPRHELAAAMPHFMDPAIVVPSSFLMWPCQLSFWGNETDGDCVSAEEAFAKATASPQTFFPEHYVVAWARLHGYLNGATLPGVMRRMENHGWLEKGKTYQDGGFNSVDWTNDAALRSAIYSNGPVKIGVAADALDQFIPSNAGGGVDSGWFVHGYPAGLQTDHCTSLCGFGTVAEMAPLFAQHGVTLKVPVNIPDTTPGYAMFTWCSIGFVDRPSLLAMCGEAWVRKPTTVVK